MNGPGTHLWTQALCSPFPGTQEPPTRFPASSA